MYLCCQKYWKGLWGLLLKLNWPSAAVLIIDESLKEFLMTNIIWFQL